MEHAEALPEFRNPPVVEVAIGVQFARIPTFRQAHFGRFWSQIADDYPNTDDRPRLDPMAPLPKSGGTRFEMQMLDTVPSHRAWFLSADDSRLVQLQDDRLVHNWRKRDAEYPRFQALREDFWVLSTHLRSVLGLPDSELRATAAEVTYINWVEERDIASFLASLNETALELPGLVPLPVAQQFAVTFAVTSDGNPVGRLSVEAKPATRRHADQIEHGNLLTLTYVGALEGAYVRSVIDPHLDRGHELIVGAFAELTHPRMHTADRWDRV